jgi:hypothetical protein
VASPNIVDGIAQKAIEGTGMTYSFGNADASTTHTTQHFERFSVQGLYNDGWMLSAVPTRPSWVIAWGKINLDPAGSFKFELYDVRHDWTQNDDVAAKYPAQMRKMTDLMFAEFTKYNVLPLDATVITWLAAPQPSLAAGRRVFTYTGEPVTSIPNGVAPNLLATSYTITVEINVPQGGAESVVVTNGGRLGGYKLHLLKGKPVFTWNLIGLKMVRWEGPDVLAPSSHMLECDLKYEGLGFATLAFASPSSLVAQAPAPSRWTERRSPSRRWIAPFRFRCRLTRHSISAPTPARQSTIGTTKYRLPSPAGSTR